MEFTFRILEFVKSAEAYRLTISGMLFSANAALAAIAANAPRSRRASGVC
jgi:hypothetical protein